MWKGMSPGQLSINHTDFKARTGNVLKSTPLIDGHNDLPFLLRTQLDNRIYGNRFPFREGLMAGGS